jgi:hypothetical protein
MMEIEDFAAHANIGELARRTARIVEWEIQGKFTASQAFDEIRKVYLELKNSTEEIRGATNV